MADPNPNNTVADSEAEPSVSAPLVYGLGLAFVILMMICYIRADIVLGWLESITKALFL